MAKKIVTENYGLVQVIAGMFDIDGTNLEEGITVKSLEDNFLDFEIIGWYEDINKHDLDELITINL